MKIVAYYRAIKAYMCLTYMKFFNRIKELKYSFRNHFGNNVRLNFHSGSVVSIGNDVGLRNNVCLTCRDGAELHLGDNTFFNNGCMVVSNEKIVIEKVV